MLGYGFGRNSSRSFLDCFSRAESMNPRLWARVSHAPLPQNTPRGTLQSIKLSPDL
jgi:hypothetical protein